MTITIDVMNQGTFSLLKNLEGLGLIHIQPSVSRETAPKEQPNRWMRGIHRNIPGGSVDDFLTSCREDKEQELAREKREQEERDRHAKRSGL